MSETAGKNGFKTGFDAVGRIGIFLGGKSRERAISLRSGEAVYQALLKTGLSVEKIDPAAAEWRRASSKLRRASNILKRLRHRPIDLAFIALHGAGGEDGSIQKVLERFRIPYVGSNPKASRAAFDKTKAKRLFRRFGIPTPDYQVITRKNWRQAIKRWRPPYVIKPACEGSSIGVSFVDQKPEAKAKIRSALRRYPVLLIERKITGREFTVGILAKRALPVIELKPKRKFYDFKAKYTKGLTEYLVPAPISKSLSRRLQHIALDVHRLLGLRDLSRVDMMMDASQEPYVLEVNSIPGFTETSLLPKAARSVGIEFDELCLQLVRFAASRQRNGRKD